MTAATSGRTYRTVEVCALTGATYREVSYWATLGLIPGQPTTMGPGMPRAWTEEQIETLREMKAARRATSIAKAGRMPSVEQLVELGSVITRLRSALAGHHRCEVDGVDRDCYLGNCDHDDVCPEVTFVCCAACLAIAHEIDEEMIPAVVFAKNCPACVAFSESDGQS